MNADLLAILEYIEREKGVSREIILEAIQSSLVSASKKSLGHPEHIDIKIDPETADIKVFTDMEVVEEKTGAHNVISLKQARSIKSDVKVGDVVNVEITPQNFGRIAAQTAKQVIIQKLREAEKEHIRAEYEEQIGDMVTGIVRRYSKGIVIVDLGSIEAILPPKEQSHGEKYPIGSRLSCLILEVGESSRGPEIVLSRTHPDFVTRLFELEVPEISEGMVEIKAIAREPGYRTKIAVVSKNEKIDCVGACVGMRGARVKNIVRELNGEKIDIIRYSSDIAAYAENALSPAKLSRIEVSEGRKAIIVFVEDDQLSLAIGRKGQNARLTSKLLGWGVDIFVEKEGLVNKVGEEETSEEEAKKGEETKKTEETKKSEEAAESEDTKKAKKTKKDEKVKKAKKPKKSEEIKKAKKPKKSEETKKAKKPEKSKKSKKAEKTKKAVKPKKSKKITKKAIDKAESEPSEEGAKSSEEPEASQ